MEIEDALKNVVDPELGIDIVTLKLVRKIDIVDDTVKITMTFTTPLCPFGPELVKQVEAAVLSLGYSKCSVELEFDPPWEPSEEVKMMLGI